MDNFDFKKYLAEGKLNEKMFDVATTEKIAQHIADAFTAEDTELDLKYKVTPGTGESSFDLDVEAGPNTPGEDWKDKGGFGIENYLGDYAGGSFYIKDGVVYNAASRNAPVAKVSPEGEVEMISAEDSRAAMGIEEAMNDDEIRDLARKKSVGFDLPQAIIEPAIDVMVDMVRGIEALGLDPQKELEDQEVSPEQIQQVMSLVKDFHQNLRTLVDDFVDAGGLDEAKEAPKSNKMKKSELKEMIRAAFLSEAEGDEEEVDIDVEDEIDVDTDAESVDAGEMEVTQNADAGLTGEKKDVQDNLEAALEAAKQLGDQKLVDQIGNSITFFTRQHVVGKGEVAEADIDVDSPAEEAEIGMNLDESINRMQKLAGLIK